LPDLIASVRRSAQRIEIEPHPALRRYLNGAFFAEYDDSVDLRSVDEAILQIPFLLNVAPVVWATGGDYTVDAVDERLAQSLSSLSEVLRGLYPELFGGGHLRPRRTIESREPADGRPAPPVEVAALFSGGVDSVYTALAADPASKLLVTVWGSDVALDDERGWRAVRDRAGGFARDHGHRLATVRSNFRDFLNYSQLNYLAPSVPDWWAYVQHGMGLIGLTAPVLATHGSHRLLIAATHTEAYCGPWGSNPAIDTSTAWGTLSVDHHGFEVSRQEKLAYLTKRFAAGSGAAPFLRVCYSSASPDGGNCGRCEKCLRTATGLVLEGADPVEFGLRGSPERLGPDAIAGFSAHRLQMGEDEVFMWEDLKTRARAWLSHERGAGTAGSGALPAYFRWLCDFDFAAYSRDQAARQRSGRRLRSALARFPRAQRAIRRLLGRGPRASSAAR
jgi:hypothetical protein